MAGDATGPAVVAAGMVVTGSAAAVDGVTADMVVMSGAAVMAM